MSGLRLYNIDMLYLLWFLPVLLGLMWLWSPAAVFFLAAAMAGVSFVLAMMIPRHPEIGNETIFSRLLPAPAE